MHSRFLNGSVPDQLHFQELIDSTINKNDDGLLRIPGNPLLIQSNQQATHTEQLRVFQNA